MILSRLLILVFVSSVIIGQPQETDPVGITSRYDRFKDLTTVYTRGMVAKQWDTAKPYIVFISAAFTYKGKSLTRPPASITLGIYCGDRYSSFSPHGTSFIALVDGRRILLPHIKGSLRNGLVRVPLKTFRDLIGGAKVEMQIDALEFSLPLETLTELRALDLETIPPRVKN